MAIADKKVVLTREGLENIESEYTKLVNVQKPQVIKRIQTAREFGDLSENSEYDAAKEEQALIETRILELHDILKNAQIVKETNNEDIVMIGSKVVVEINDEIHEFAIVGSVEADPASNKISNESPVGKSLLGLKAGESIDVAIGPVKRKIKVLEIK